jgi:dTMP kinase
MQARLITFEGTDGVGKTTHVSRTVNFLAGQGLEVATYREPGATALGEELRGILKRGVATAAIAELMLFAAARAELVHTRVIPDLARGLLVVLDRFTDSTLAYQGALGQIDEAELQACCQAAAQGLVPDLTLWLDLEPADAFQRGYPLAQALGADAPADTELDAIERRSIGYFSRVRERYRALADAERDRIVRIDASDSIDETAKLVRATLIARLKVWRGEDS